jgi:hypothetical protein
MVLTRRALGLIRWPHCAEAYLGLPARRMPCSGTMHASRLRCEITYAAIELSPVLMLIVWFRASSQ